MNIFYLVFILLIVILTLTVGLVYLFNPPRSTRVRYGYRDKYALMNQENFDLAQQIITISYICIGLLDFLGVAPILANFNNTFPFWGFILILAIEAILTISPIIYTHFILKHHTKKYNLANENERY